MQNLEYLKAWGMSDEELEHIEHECSNSKVIYLNDLVRKRQNDKK